MIFKSHPEKDLMVHLKEVWYYSKAKLHKEEGRALEIMCLCHDFGKYTSFFQDYLLHDEKSTPKTNHGFISALFTAYIGLKEFGEESILPLVAYNGVLYHHGSVRNFEANLPKSMKKFNKGLDSANLMEKVKIAKEQLQDMYKNKEIILADYEEVGLYEYCKVFIEDKPIEEVLKKLYKLKYKFNKNNGDVKVYFQSQKLYSYLIAGDKLSASSILNPEEKFAEYNKLDSIKNKMFKDSTGKINMIRSEIFNKIQKCLVENYNKSNIFSITSPTGTGKTYSGYFAAQKLNELLGGDRRVIYSLPFTAIINQNFENICDLYKPLVDYKKNKSSYVMMHHSYADVEFSKEDEDFSKVQSEMLMENWSSGVIITTFVQLLETLIGNRNRMLKKFHSLKDSIILLDEVQAIPVEYYNLVDYVLRKVTEELNCRIIMMTATRPLFLENAIELLPNNENYFNMFNRTKLIPKLNPVTIDEFTEDFIENIEDKSYLIVCNTISQSLEVYKKLSALKRDVLYLSTNLLPIHRKERIEEVKGKLKNGEKPILVSTQVIEAGVDLDFHKVIRDIAPIDSIIQSAGRCNRNGKRKDVGEVIVCAMKDNSGNLYGKYVYGKASINICKELLTLINTIKEKEYYNLINDYFTKIVENKNQDASRNFIESINNLFFDKSPEEEYSLDKFSLIKDLGLCIDIFFRFDYRAEETYQTLLRGFSEKDINKKNEIFISLKSKIRDYTISLPKKFYSKFDKDSVVINLPREGCDDYYDKDTGFRRDDKDEYVFF